MKLLKNENRINKLLVFFYNCNIAYDFLNLKKRNIINKLFVILVMIFLFEKKVNNLVVRIIK